MPRKDKRFLTHRRTFGADAVSPDIIKAMPTEITFDYFAVRLNGEKGGPRSKSVALEQSLIGASDQAR
jgi:alkyl sulfatase BDS1-like metallo-beta-lactamase superfamily hydrolase